MKRIFVIMLTAVLIFSTTYAEPIDAPYDTFVELKDGDQIDLNGDGRMEKIRFSSEPISEYDPSYRYTISVGDSYIVENDIVSTGDIPRLFAAEMFYDTYLFVSGSEFNNWYYDIYVISPWDSISRPYCSSGKYAQAVQDFEPYAGYDYEVVLPDYFIKMGQSLPILETTADENGTTWYSLGVGNEVLGYATDLEVRCIDENEVWNNELDYWTLRYIPGYSYDDEPQFVCYGEPEHLKVTDVNTFSAPISYYNISSPLFRRAEFFIYSKDWSNSDGALVQHKTGVFQVPAGAFALVPENYACVTIDEFPLYNAYHSTEPGDILFEGEEVAILFATEDGWFYAEQIPNDPSAEKKSGWFRTCEHEFQCMPLVNGEPIPAYLCFSGLFFGG